MSAPIDGGEKGYAGNAENMADTLQLPEILASPQDFKELREHIRSIDGDRVGKVVVLGFRALQLYRIAKLQGRLIEVQNAVLKGGANESLKTDTPQEIDADALIQRYGE